MKEGEEGYDELEIKDVLQTGEILLENCNETRKKRIVPCKIR